MGSRKGREAVGREVVDGLGDRRGRQGWGARMRRCEEEEDMRTRERGGRLKAKCPSAVRETDTSGLIFACVK